MTCFHQILCATGHIVQIQVLVHNHFHFLTKCMSLDCVLACSWGSSGPRVDLDLQLWWHSGCAEYLHPFYFSVFDVFQQSIHSKKIVHVFPFGNTSTLWKCIIHSYDKAGWTQNYIVMCKNFREYFILCIVKLYFAGSVICQTECSWWELRPWG